MRKVEEDMKENWKKSVLAALFLLMLAALCLVSEKAEAKAPKLSKTKLTMTLGQKKTLKVKNTKKKVKWKSSNAKIVKVSKKGVLTARKAGKATVRAMVGKKTLRCKVTVKKRKNMAGQASGKCRVQGGIYYIRTNGGRDGVKYPSGVLISSKKALQKYYQENRQYYAMAGSFKKTIDSFDKAYFKTKQIAVLRLETGSGSDTYRVISMDYSSRKYQVKVEMGKQGTGTRDMAQWHILIPVPEKIPTDSKIEVTVSLPEENQYAKAMREAKLDKDGKPVRSLTEYAGIQTLTNGFTAQAADGSGNQDFSGVRAFSYDLFHQIISGSSEYNPVVSPVSAYFALSMAASGSSGETQAQFAKVLGTTADMLEKNGMCSQLKKHLLSTKGSTALSIANSVWVNQDFRVSNDYLQGIVDYFDSEVYSGKIDSAEMQNAVNQWGNEKTQGLIPKFLDDKLTGDAVLELMNAVYLNAAWSQPFPKDETREMAFRKQDNSEIRTKFLHSGWNLDYVETSDAEGAVLPYNDGKTVFLVLRPTDGSSIREFAGKLDAERVKNYISNARNAKVDFYMPKAELSYNIYMNPMLLQMGLVNAFDSRADFSKMAAADYQGGRIYIDRVFQKVKVKVNEKGTEAAAITDVQMKAESAARPEPKVIRTLKLDSPYVYLVVDLASQTPLFMGVMEEPSSN